MIYNANHTLFATHLQLDLKLNPVAVALPIALANTCFFLSSLLWGWLAERIGRRWAIIIPAALGGPTAFIYLLAQDYAWVIRISRRRLRSLRLCLLERDAAFTWRMTPTP